MYASTFTGATIGAAQDLWQIAADSNVAIVIHQIYLGQRDLTTNDQMRITIHRGTGTLGSGTTAVPLDIATKHPDGVYVLNNSTQHTLGVIVHSVSFSVLDNWTHRPPPLQRIFMAGGSRLVVSSDIAITPGTWDGIMIAEEIG